MKRLAAFFATPIRAALGIAFGLALTVAAAQSIGPLIVQASQPALPGISLDGAPTVGTYYNGIIAGFSRHVGAGSIATANLPVLTACGTSAALTTGSTDHAGTITVGTSASAGCTLTFGTTYTAAPVCVYQNRTTGAPANVLTISATALVWSSVLADSTVLDYICLARGT